MTKQSDVERAQEGAPLIVRDNAKVAAFLAAAKADSDRDPLEVQLDMVRRILDAETVDAVFSSDNEVTHWKEALGVPFTVLDVKWNESTVNGGAPMYAVCDAVDVNGEPCVLTTGAVQPMAQLFQLAKLGAFPCTLILHESDRATAQGYKPQRLELAPKPF